MGGTSEASPIFAGIVAIADQLAGQPLGNLNPRLYQMGLDPAANGIVDVTIGYNGYAGVPGFYALPGYDLITGWGTIDAALFVPALAGEQRGDQQGQT